MSYLDDRVYGELGFTPADNRIRIRTTDRFGQPAEVDMPIFKSNDKDDIGILVYTLERTLIEYDHPRADPLHRNPNNDRTQHYVLTRLNPARVTKGGPKYLMPKGRGVYPFLPPQLVEAYEAGRRIDTLYLTEGYFKAAKAAKHGLPIVGLSSITHYASSNTKKMHPAVVKIIEKCRVKNVVMLYDGDCLNLSPQALAEGGDLATRPNGFFQSMVNVRELLLDYDVAVWFAHVNSADLPGQPKGLDDLLCSMPGREAEAVAEMADLARPSTLLVRMNVSAGTKRLQGYFNLRSAEQFHGYWSEAIGDREFVYFGSTYRRDPSTGKVEKTMPKELKNFLRVGDDYYEIVEMPVLYGSGDVRYDGETERRMFKRKKQTITDDFGRELVKKIPRYKAFVNMPSHTNYQQVVNNCWNQYSPIGHEPAPGDWTATDMFLRHIFGEQYELGLDYLQILYQYPAQMLPILCLVSQERQTGKTTFIDFLKMIFGENCAKVGNAEISSQFNSFLTSRLIVAVDETNLEKNRDITERIKMLSTTSRIFSQAKGVDYVEQWHFAKYILTSNFETNFIYTQDDEIRFWVRKVPHIDTVAPTLLNDLHDEVPAFLHFLSTRRISRPKTTRMWFAPAELETEALRRLKERQKPLVERELRQYMHDLFLDFPAPEYLMTVEALQARIPSAAKRDGQYLHNLLRENLHLKKYAKDGREVTCRFKLPRYTMAGGPAFGGEQEVVWDRYFGRPYVFPRGQFLTPAELADQLQAEQQPVEAEEQQTRLDF